MCVHCAVLLKIGDQNKRVYTYIFSSCIRHAYCTFHYTILTTILDCFFFHDSKNQLSIVDAPQ